MLLQTLLLLSSLQTPSGITVNAEVGNAAKVVAKLAEASGLKMTAVGPVASEVVFLRVENRPLAEVMASLARVTCATWDKQSDGSYQLVRPGTKTDAEFNKRFSSRLKVLNAYRDELLAGLDEAFTTENLEELVKRKIQLDSVDDQALTETQRKKNKSARSHLYDCDPMNRALARCIRDIDLSPAASLRIGEAVVFCSSPNSVQLPLGGSAREAMQSVLPEQVGWGKALKAIPMRKDDTEDNRFDTDSEIRTFGHAFDGSPQSVWGRSLPFDWAPDHVILNIANYGGAYGDVFDLKLFTNDGHITFHLFTGDRWSDYEPSPYENTQGKAIQPTAETGALWARMKSKGKKVEPSLVKLQRFFDDPVNNDPLWLGNQELLTAMATTKHKSVIACLTDDARGDNPEDFNLDGYATRREMEASESSDMIELRPASFADHWLTRADRAAMAECTKSYRKLGHIDLMTFVRYMGACREPDDWSFGYRFAQLVDPSDIGRFDGYKLPDQSALILLLAKLSSGQLERLKKGETIPYGELTSEQISLVYTGLFGEQGSPSNGFGESAAERIANIDPTLELPNGVLQGAGLSAKFGDDHYAVFHNNADGDYDNFWTTDLSDPNPPGFYGGPGPRVPAGGMAAATVSLCSQEQITLKCALMPGHYVTGRFSAPMVTTAKPVLISQLPQDIQKKLKSVVEFLEQMSPGRYGKIDPPKP